MAYSSSSSSSSGNFDTIKKNLSATGSSLYGMITGIPQQASNLANSITTTTSNAVNSISNPAPAPAPAPAAPLALAPSSLPVAKIGGKHMYRKKHKSRKYKTLKSKLKKNKSKIRHNNRSKKRKYKK
jgi:hypothetical protein